MVYRRHYKSTWSQILKRHSETNTAILFETERKKNIDKEVTAIHYSNLHMDKTNLFFASCNCQIMY